MFKAWVGFALAVGSTGDFVQPEKSNNANRQVNDIFMEVDSAMLSNSASLFRVIFGPLPRSSAIFFRRSESWKNRQGNEVYGGYGTPLKLIAPAAAPLDPLNVGKSSFAERASAKVKLLFAHWLVATRDERANYHRGNFRSTEKPCLWRGAISGS